MGRKNSGEVHKSPSWAINQPQIAHLMLFLSKGGGQEILSACVCCRGHISYDRSGAPTPACNSQQWSDEPSWAGTRAGQKERALARQSTGHRGCVWGPGPSSGLVPCTPSPTSGAVALLHWSLAADVMELTTDVRYSCVKWKFVIVFFHGNENQDGSCKVQLHC